MINHKLVSVPLSREFIRLARLARSEGYAIGSTSERIVAALLNGRADWLPEPYLDPLEAVKRLHAGGADWWHTMLYVHGQDWRE
ncbi:hypothetical protein [Qipengyuania sp.]|uniref:hypothetical protein n=1 Tax=Qipengyuania sp. TaxID=2004515 RepID=UPI003736CC9F